MCPVCIPGVGSESLSSKEFAYCDAINEDEFNHVLDSNQAQFIQKFTINLSGFNNLIDYLYKLEKLVELKITSGCLWSPRYYNAVYIYDLLGKMESTLTTLKLVNIIISPINISTIPICRNIKTLTLQNSIRPKCMDRSISQAFPNLRTLIIKFCSSMPYYFYLRNLDLFYLKVMDNFSPNMKYISIKTLCSNEKRYYSTNDIAITKIERNEQLSDVVLIESMSCDSRYITSTRIYFICNSLYKFTIVNAIP